MRNLRIVLLLVLLTGVFTVADARPRPHHNHRPPKHVSTPLDGGLLSILGVAGVAYYLTRKKKDQKDI